MTCQEKLLEMLEIIHKRTVTPEIVTGFRLPLSNAISFYGEICDFVGDEKEPKKKFGSFAC